MNTQTRTEAKWAVTGLIATALLCGGIVFHHLVTKERTQTTLPARLRSVPTDGPTPIASGAEAPREFTPAPLPESSVALENKAAGPAAESGVPAVLPSQGRPASRVAARADPRFRLAGPEKMYGRIVCPNPNCGYRGPAGAVPYGSGLLAVLLFLVCILPGVIYWLFCFGTLYVCPACRCMIGRDSG